MSNQNTKRNVGIVIVVIIIVAAIIGGYSYYTSSASTGPTQTMSTVQSAAQSMVETTPSVMASNEPVSILGAGATFPAPLIQKWTVTYKGLNPWVTINYNPIGSGGGIQQITQKTVDFGASDAPLSDAQLANATGLVLMPETLGGVAITYNLQHYGISNGTVINFTGDVIANIYMGKIKLWSDPAIAALNPNLKLPTATITAVHRSDGSGTTYAFTNYLSVVNTDWKTTVGYSTSVTWPVDKIGTGIGAKGNAGVAGTVANTPGSIGYVDVIYATGQSLGIGAVKNAAGNFVSPNLQTIAYAAANATGTPNPNDLRMHIVNAAGDQSYPIATYTYILLYKEMSNQPSMTLNKAQALVKFLWWAIHDGQQYAPSLIYVPLPQNIVSADEQLLKSETYQGQTLITS